LDRGKLLSSDVNSLCPLIFKATSKNKLHKKPFLVSVYSHAAAGESWHAFTEVMLVYTSWNEIVVSKAVRSVQLYLIFFPKSRI